MLLRLAQNALAHLSPAAQYELRRAKFSRLIRRGQFLIDEPEGADVVRYLRPGDWAVDVGANIGRYTCQMGRCVGAAGRVLAFEPIPETFAILAGNVRTSQLRNVSLFNIGLSSEPQVLGMTVPAHEQTSLNNYYQAHIVADGDYQVLCLPLDALPIPGKVRLVKVDAEGHDLKVLQGMRGLLERDRPALIVEGSLGGEIAAWLQERRYGLRKNEGSPNIVAQPLEWA